MDNGVLISFFAFALFLGGGLLGMLLRRTLPAEHFSDEPRHLLETGLGIIGTIGGLILGLIVASAFGSYNAQRSSLVELSANVVLLDRLLAHYGPEAQPSRTLLRGAVSYMLDDIWSPDRGRRPGAIAESVAGGKGESFFEDMQELKPKNEKQTSIKGTAIALAISIGQTRWLMYAQLTSGLSVPLLVVLMFWFTITFIGLGIFGRPNGTVIWALVLSAFAVAGAIFILQEMYSPFQGPMQIPNAPLRAALTQMGR